MTYCLLHRNADIPQLKSVLMYPKTFPGGAALLFLEKKVLELFQSHLKLEIPREWNNPLAKEMWIHLKFIKTLETCWSHTMVISHQGRPRTSLATGTLWCHGSTVLAGSSAIGVTNFILLLKAGTEVGNSWTKTLGYCHEGKLSSIPVKGGREKLG